jgi:hypothetical protein
MTYFQYIFSDKKSRVYWIIVLILITFLTFLRAVILLNNNSNFDFLDYFQLSFYFIIFFIIYVGFYTSSYFAYKTQYRFTDYYKSRIERKSIFSVLINQDKFTIKPLFQSYDVKVSIPLRKDNYQICKIGDSLIILGQVYDFGTFMRHMRPLQINLSNSTNDRLKFAIKPFISDMKINNNDLEIKFKNSVNGINKLVIIDYTKQNLD